MLQVARILACTALALLLSACQTFAALNFVPDANSGHGGGLIELKHVGLSSGDTSATIEEVSKWLDARGSEQVGKACMPKQENGQQDTKAVEMKAAGAVVPLVAAGATALVNIVAEDSLHHLDVLKKSATQTYSARIAVDDWPNLAKHFPCFVLFKWEDDKRQKPPHFVAVVKVVPFESPAAWQAEVIAAVARKAAAVAAPTDPPTIDVTVGVAVSALHTFARDGAARFVALGAESIQLPTLSIGCSDDCSVPDRLKHCSLQSPRSSSLLPSPAARPWLLAVSVAEVGNVPVDVDRAAGEVRAIQAALGPAVGESISKWLAPPD